MGRPQRTYVRALSTWRLPAYVTAIKAALLLRWETKLRQHVSAVSARSRRGLHEMCRLYNRSR